MTLMPDAGAREVLLALARDLALVPWVRDWRPASPRAFGDWRQAAGPEALEELQRVVLGAAREKRDEHDWRAAVIGRLKAASADGTLIRMPDTRRAAAAFGSTGTGDDSAPFPQLRALMMNDASTRSLLGMRPAPRAGTRPPPSKSCCTGPWTSTRACSPWTGSGSSTGTFPARPGSPASSPVPTS